MTLPTLVSARLPTGELNENRAIDIIGEWFSMAPHGTWLDKEYSRELLQTMLEEGLREGEYDLAKCAVDAANAGNEIADAALRTIAREMLGDALPERKPGHAQVRAYGQRALNQPHKRPRGRSRHDNLVRDLQICFYVILACHEFGVRPTRNRYTYRSNRAPSGISLVVAALARHRNPHLLDAVSVQKNTWNGLPGALARRHAPASLWPR